MNDIDWTQVHARLKASNQAMLQALEPDAAHVAAIGRRRAAYLSQRSRQKKGETGQPVLIFQVQGERYALALESLSEIAGPSICTPLPGLADRLLGLVNLHGEIRPVLDTAALLGIPWKSGERRKPGAILYLRWNRRVIGLAADLLEGMGRLSEAELAAPTPEGPAMPRRFIKAITREALALIDVPSLLAGTGLEEDGLNDKLQEGTRA